MSTNLPENTVIDHDGHYIVRRRQPYSRAKEFCDSTENERVSDRQERISGFDQQALSNAHVALIGAGMAGEIAEGLVRKGVGTLTIVDFDTVSWTNFNRQFFLENQEGQMKAHCLAENLAPHNTSGTEIRSISLSLDRALDSCLLDLAEVDVLVVAVDNVDARIEASEAAQTLCPVIFTAVDLAGEAAMVAVQEPGKACYGCILPHGLSQPRLPCAAPSVKDTNKLAGGAVLYTIDTLLMPGRIRAWNYQEFHLAGVLGGWRKSYPKRPGCPLCEAGQGET